jgi:hypothetical protein
MFAPNKSYDKPTASYPIPQSGSGNKDSWRILQASAQPSDEVILVVRNAAVSALLTTSTSAFIVSSDGKVRYEHNDAKDMSKPIDLYYEANDDHSLYELGVPDEHFFYGKTGVNRQLPFAKLLFEAAAAIGGNNIYVKRRPKTTAQFAKKVKAFDNEKIIAKRLLEDGNTIEGIVKIYRVDDDAIYEEFLTERKGSIADFVFLNQSINKLKTLRILHLDINRKNIGYSKNGRPTLFDFDAGGIVAQNGVEWDLEPIWVPISKDTLNRATKLHIDLLDMDTLQLQKMERDVRKVF